MTTTRMMSNKTCTKCESDKTEFKSFNTFSYWYCKKCKEEFDPNTLYWTGSSEDWKTRDLDSLEEDTLDHLDMKVNLPPGKYTISGNLYSSSNNSYYKDQVLKYLDTLHFPKVELWDYGATYYPCKIPNHRVELVVRDAHNISNMKTIHNIILTELMQEFSFLKKEDLYIIEETHNTSSISKYKVYFYINLF